MGTERKKQSKYLRAENPALFRLTDGDLQILHYVYYFRYITTPMLVMITGRAPQKINARTRFLYDAGYLERLHLPHPRSGGGSQQSIHVLDEKGLQLLSEYLKVPRKEMGTSPKHNENPEMILRHKLLISYVQAAVVAAVRHTEWLELLFWQRESDQYKQTVYAQGEELRVFPDAFFGVMDTRQPAGRQRYFFFLEADRSTMDHKDMRNKFAGYYQLWKQHQHEGSPVFHGIKKFRVLTVIDKKGKGTKRLENCLRDAHDITPGGHGSGIFWFTEQDQLPLSPTALLEPVWRVAKGHSQTLYRLFND